MRGRNILAIVVLLVTACSTPATQATPSAPPAGSGSPGAASPDASPSVAPVTLRFGNNSDLSFSFTPALAAFEALKNEVGITVEVTPFAEENLSTSALLAGQVDFATIGPAATMKANTSGSDIRIFFTGQNNEWLLVTKAEITDPSQLGAKRIARSGTSSNNWALLLDTKTKYNVEPEFLDVAGSENRVLALIAGQVDGAVITFSDFEALERQAPGQFHVLVNYEETNPGVLTGDNMGATTESLAKNHAAFEQVTKYLITYYERAATDPEWFADQGIKYFPDGDRAEYLATATTLKNAGVYKTDGGLSIYNAETFDTYIKTYLATGNLEESEVQDFEEVYDPSFVQAASGS